MRPLFGENTKKTGGNFGYEKSFLSFVTRNCDYGYKRTHQGEVA